MSELLLENIWKPKPATSRARGHGNDPCRQRTLVGDFLRRRRGLDCTVLNMGDVIEFRAPPRRRALIPYHAPLAPFLAFGRDAGSICGDTLDYTQIGETPVWDVPSNAGELIAGHFRPLPKDRCPLRLVECVSYAKTGGPVIDLEDQNVGC